MNIVQDNIIFQMRILTFVFPTLPRLPVSLNRHIPPVIIPVTVHFAVNGRMATPNDPGYLPDGISFSSIIGNILITYG